MRGREPLAATGRISKEKHWTRYLADNTDLYLFLLPAVLYFIIFHYWPMYGAVIAFKDFIPVKGIFGSPWVGFAHFERFFQSYFFTLLIRNTLLLSLFSLLLAFPVSIIFALMLNQVEIKLFKSTLQTASYIPFFISTVVFVGMLFIFLSPTNGFVNRLIIALGGEATSFMGSAPWFRPVYIISDIWKETGYNAIIYLAALSAINPEQHEAAIVDGATKLQRIRHIDIPGIAATVVVILILRVGQIMSIGFEKAYLMQTALNLDASEIIPTYVYKTGADWRAVQLRFRRRAIQLGHQFRPYHRGEPVCQKGERIQPLVGI